MPSLRHTLAVLVSLTSAVSLAVSDLSPPPIIDAEPSPGADASTPEAEVTAPPAEAAAAPPPATARRAARGEEAPLSSITLSDGQKLRGVIIAETPKAVTLELVTGGKMELARRNIRSIKEEDRAAVAKNGQLWFRDPNRTRYFYSPSAMMLKKGEGYFSQKELFFSAVAYGITDNVSILVGSVLPLWLMGGNGINLIGAVKAGFSPADGFHLAAGFETLVVPGFGFGGGSSLSGMGFLFAGATIGNSDAHFTINAGRPFMFTGGTQNVGDALFTLCGNFRVGSNFALVTENWLMPTFFGSPSLTMLNSAGGRFFGEHWAVDLGFIHASFAGTSMFIPVPWVDFTYNFG